MIDCVPVICVGCGTPTKSAVKGRCPDCAPAHERKRLVDRLQSQPWTRAYRTSRWQRCRAVALERDDHRCRLRLDGCADGERLVGHHAPRSLEELWRLARGDWSTFVDSACDVENVVTACEPCHAADDARRRANVKGGRARVRRGGARSAPGLKIPRLDASRFFSAHAEAPEAA